MNPMQGYFSMNKRSLFPTIKDWTLDDPKNIKGKKFYELKYNEWFFFHPIGYNLINYGFTAMFLINLGIGTLYAISKNNMFMSAIGGIAFILVLLSLTKKLNNFNVESKTTLYDMFMKEEKEDLK